jgi:hypothetical protein
VSHRRGGVSHRQGNVPPYAVVVATASGVTAALAFAASHNLRVVVKASGHEFQV